MTPSRQASSTDARILRCSIIACWLLLIVAHPLGHREALAAAQAEAAPRVQLDETEFDFGTIYQYEESAHTFVFHNRGNASLRIGKVRSTCGCAGVLLTKADIAPGEDGELKVTFIAGALRGRVIKHVYVDTNDPAQPRVSLRITAEVKVALDLRPRGVYVGRLSAGQAIERFLDLVAIEAPTYRILEVSANHPAITVGDPVKLEGKQCTYRLSIQVGPIAEPGRLNARVIVRTDLEHALEISIPVYGKITEGG